ncbi:hypothetical protein QTP86_011548 [Hemibagrus guttatus]|nr:hypothetical protein QTP86_011548 [Hemibagrus guttatus]
MSLYIAVFIFPSILTRKTSSQHDAATTILHCRDGIGQVMSSAWFPPDMTLVIQAKVFNLCCIRPENFVSHGLRVLQVPFGKLQLLKFADDTTVIGLIQDGDESAYRQEVEQQAAWRSLNNLELNTLKTVEMIVDFRRNTPALPPLTIVNSTVSTVESFRFLGTTISQDLKWDTHIDSIIKKAQQRLNLLRQLSNFNLPQELLTQFYSAVIESVLCTSNCLVCSATKSNIRRLQRMVRTAERIIGAPLPTLQELYTSRVRKRALKITLDPSHPGH